MEVDIMDIEGNFDLNIFEAINYGLEQNIPEAYNLIGASEISLGMRKNLIKKLLGIAFKGNAKTLFGTMFEDILHKTDVQNTIITQINEKIGLEVPMEIDDKKQDFLEIFDDYKLRLTPDTWTTYYTIEVKTTSIYTREWSRTLAPYQANQLNTYLGYYKQNFGFLLKVNSRAFISNINNYQEGYWKKLWHSYGYIIPIQFDSEMYDRTIERANTFFKHLDVQDINVPCPEISWECKYCDPRVIKVCGKVTAQCPECKKKMLEWPNCLTDAYIETPVCESCFNKITPNGNYEKFKYLAKYPWEL